MHRPQTLSGVALVALVVGGLSSGACSGAIASPSSPSAAARASTDGKVATGLTISGGMTLSARGETEPLAAMVTFGDGSVQDRSTTSSWSSTNEAVATVSPAGVVTAMTDGRTMITASFGNLSATKLILVDLP